MDTSGNVYVADTTNNTIRKITPIGAVTTIAGRPGIAAGFQDGPATNASGGALFNNPYGIAIDVSNNIYVADTYNNMIRKIANGVVTTLAGSQTSGTNNATGTNAQFSLPYALATDSAGNVYVADTSNNLIRLVTPVGVVTTIAGTGGTLFSSPSGIAVDSATNVYVADTDNQIVRKITFSGTNWVVSIDWSMARGVWRVILLSGDGDGTLSSGDIYAVRWGWRWTARRMCMWAIQAMAIFEKSSRPRLTSSRHWLVLTGATGAFPPTVPEPKRGSTSPNGVAVDSATNFRTWRTP